MVIMSLILAALFLIQGRKMILSIFIILGFLSGFTFGLMTLPPTGGWTTDLVIILFGVLGALMVMLIRWAVVVFALGFWGAGFIAVNLFPVFSFQPQLWYGFFSIAGIIGMLAMVFAFDWMLIGASSLLGAMFIVNVLYHLKTPAILLALLAFVLAIGGTFIQSLSLRPAKRAKTPEETPVINNRLARLGVLEEVAS